MVQSINNHKSVFYNDNSLFFCSECNGLIISDKLRGDTICENCGLIESEKEIETKKLRRIFFEKPQSITRDLTSFLLLPDISYATYIDKKKYNNIENKRLIKVDSWFKNTKNLSDMTGIIEIKRICHNLQIPSPTIAMAIYIFKKTCKNISFKGRSMAVKVDGCIYYACRKYSTPILYQEIIDQNSVSEKLLKKIYVLIIRTFKLKSPVIIPELLLSRFISDLELSIEFEKKAKGILAKIPPNHFQSKNPRGLCAGLIYYTTKINDLNITQKTIANACYVSIPTLSKIYQQIIKILQGSI